MKLFLLKAFAAALGYLVGFSSVEAATFDGTARVDVSDPTGGLGWNTTANAMTVSCWFKLSVPSTVTLTKNMVILANARRSDPSGAFSFLIQFNINTGNIEFTASGTSPLPAQKLIERPYLDRWYYIAVTRSGGDFAGYVDGRTAFNVSNSIGSSANTAGVFIGGAPDDGANLYGEVQEVAIYSEKQESDFIAYYMLQPQPIGVPSMRGYFKLGGVPNPDLANYATTPPAGTNPAVKAGNVLFEDTNLAGEQSTFDSRKNGGRDAMTPLSGSFAWQHTLLRRATTGIPFEFMLGYNSATANNSANFQTGTFGTSGLSAGWTHTFDARIIPADKFLAISDTTVMGLLLWDGSLEVWDGPDETNFTTRHGEYRGELKKVSSGTTGIVEWTTPDRLVYRFRTPFSGPSVMRGRLLEIRDLNPTANVITLNWDTTLGRLNSVTDTAGSTCQFNYNAQNQLLTVTYLGWTATFTYHAAAGNRLATIATTGPAAYTATPPLPTTWNFSYRTSTDVANGLLEKIASPRGQSSIPVYYDTAVTYDEFGRVKQETDALARNRITKYNVPAKRQITHTDALAKDWIETFDRKSHVTEKKDPLGNKTAFEYDAAGNVTASVDANTNRMEFTYDSRANVLTKKVVALNETTAWEYNALAGTVPLNKQTKQTDPPASHNGQPAASWVTNFQYDSGGNLLRQYDSLGDLVTNTYNVRGQLLTAKDARNNIASFTYKPEGFLSTKTVPDVSGATRTWIYDYTEHGWLQTETNPLLQTAYYFQNINGQVITTVDPIGRDFQKTYDASGNLLTESDGLHIATTYTYDAANQRTTMLTRDGKTWNYAYTLRGEPLAIRDPSLTAPTNTATYLYDDAGRRTRETDALGFFTQLFYDANGGLTKTTDKGNRDWTKKYDALNRVTEDTDPEGDKTICTYDAAGRLATLTNPRGFISRHEYDGRNRLTKWTDAEGFVWLYAYDGNGNIENITDANNGHYIMTYGPRNERLTELNQDGQMWTYTYDELLRLKTQTDPTAAGVPALVRTLHYDNGGRVESADFSTGRQTVFFFNDNNDPLSVRRTFPGQPSTTLDLTYDLMDRVTQSRDTFGKTVNYTFDFAGRMKTKVYPGSKTLTHNYDNAGRLTGLLDWAGRTSTFTYDNVGRLKTHLFPNGLTAAVGYDTAGRVTALDHGPAANPQQLALRYAYDRNGNKTSETKKGALEWQPGTAAGQIAPFAETYTPTAAGRLITSTDTLNSARNTTYTYNPAGDMTASASPVASYTFTYDEDHCVNTVGFTGGTTPKAIANRYDALGRRLARTLTTGAAAPIETRYVLDLTGDMERILADTDSTGTVLTRY